MYRIIQWPLLFRNLKLIALNFYKVRTARYTFSIGIIIVKTKNTLLHSRYKLPTNKQAWRILKFSMYQKKANISHVFHCPFLWGVGKDTINETDPIMRAIPIFKNSNYHAEMRNLHQVLVVNELTKIQNC